MTDQLAVDCGTRYARVAAGVLWFLAGQTFTVMPSWLVPDPAVWSWNGQPMIAAPWSSAATTRTPTP